MTIRIDRAQPQDFDGVVELLAQNRLPPVGLREHLATRLVARQDGGIVGSAGLEIYSDGALLRSVAIAPRLHRQRLGHSLVDAAIRLAEEHRSLGSSASREPTCQLRCGHQPNSHRPAVRARS